MTFSDLIRARYSLRTYSDRPVEREKLTACVEAARLSPSACNSQPWSFIIVDDPELISRIAPLTTSAAVPINKFVTQAPAIAVVVSERPNLSSRFGAAVKRTPFYLIDVGIAAEHFCLQAAELGLGTCMLGWFDQAAVKRTLGIPRRKKVPLLITIGYPREGKPPDKRRKELKEILDFR